MKLLAFDTSGAATSVAVWDDGVVLAEASFVDAENHSTTLMPTIDRLMTEAGLAPSDLTRIAVAQGPGSYTGLRIAVTAAKTLAFTLGIEVVGVSSLYSIAARLGLTADETVMVVPLMNARRGNVYAAVYEGNAAVLPDQHVALADFLKLLSADKKLIFTGDAEMFTDEILAAFPSAEIITDDLQKMPSAAAMAEISAILPAASDVHDFNPIYLKKVEAEEKWEAANGAVSDNKKLVSRG